MILSKRLETIAAMVSKGDCVADIGTDHAFVPIVLIKRGVCQKAVASDIGKGPLEKAREHVKDEGLSGVVDLRLGSGLSTLTPGEADSIVIAGMGGLLITDILKAGEAVAKSAKELILSPHTDYAEVRKFLSESGYVFVDEKAVFEDGKYYFVMKVRPGEGAPLSARELHYGPVLLRNRDAVLLSYLLDQKEKTEGILTSLRQATLSPQIEKARDEREAERKQIEETIQWIKQM